MSDSVSGVIGPIAEKLATLAFGQIVLAWGVREDRKKLRQKLETIGHVLMDAERRQNTDSAIRGWLQKLKNLYDDANDLIDKFEARALRKRIRALYPGGYKDKVRNTFSWISDFIFQFQAANMIKELNQRLEEIDQERAKFNLSPYDVQERSIAPRKETHSFMPVSNVVGRVKERRKIIEFLMNPDADASGKISLVPIIGIGGVGKTTLAKMAFMDDQVHKHFAVKVWISVQGKFQVEKIMRDIVESLDHNTKCDGWSMEKLQSHLRSFLENKRCLIVMDDVLDVKREDWTNLIDMLQVVSRGSKVIVTSRHKAVATIMGDVQEFNLTPLSMEESMTLFMRCAFDQGQGQHPSDLVKIGEEIARKCGGNPMALKALGSLLYSRTEANVKHWEWVRDSEIWELKTDIMPSLRISYDLMPTYLKQCFAYCSIFPKSYEFNNLELIQLWISNGLIPHGRNQSLEELGQQYWEELWSRSFFEDVAEEYLFMTFRMHDLIHDLARFIVEDDSQAVNPGSPGVQGNIRRLPFSNLPPFNGKPPNLNELTGIRSIMYPIQKEGPTGESFLAECISRFPFLRVLYLHDSSFDKLPDSIGSLEHLRFLHVCGNRKIKSLPSSVCELLNLQSLGLAKCEELEVLPANIKKMISLRFLDITTKQKILPEKGIGCLTSLVCLFIGDCLNLKRLPDDMRLLTSLQKLFIGGCPKLTSLPEGIKYLAALESLIICHCEKLTLTDGESGNSFKFGSRLRTLILTGLPGMESVPKWFEGSARSLHKIHVADCHKLRGFPDWLQMCSSLQRLKVEDCSSLEFGPDGIHGLNSLKELWIDNCAGVSIRFEAKGGEPRRKMTTHFPDIYIDGRKIKPPN